FSFSSIIILNLIFLDLFNHIFFFFSSRRRHTRSKRDWSSDVCSSDLVSITTSNSGKTIDVEGNQETPCIIELTPSGAITTYTIRSEERRVGKECRARMTPNHYIKK